MKREKKEKYTIEDNRGSATKRKEKEKKVKIKEMEGL